MSKVIKSFHDHKENSVVETDGVVIGIQSLSLYRPVNESLLAEDDESKIIRLKKEAQMILDEAKQEAARIKAESEKSREAQQHRLAEEETTWRLNIEQEFQKAKSEGYDAGYKKGLEQGHENWLSQINEVKHFIDQLKSDYHSVLSEAEPQMVILAIKAAEKILGMKLQEKPETWISIIKQLIKEAREYEEIKLYVPTHWFELTQKFREELKNMLQSTATFFIYPDETLSENGAIIEFPFGKIDATLDVQLREIREKLLEQIEVIEHER